MTAYRSVWIACNPCEDEITAGLAGDAQYADDGETFGMHDDFQTTAEVRDRARDAGWLFANGRDICPAHRDEGKR